MSIPHSGFAEDPTTSTLPRLVLRNAASFGRAAGMREKNLGIWKTHTWQNYQDNVHDFALGLASLGFRRGDKMSVVGDNCPRLYWAQIAAQALGGVAVPVYQDAIATELAYVLNHAEVSVVVVEDQEQVDKVLSLKGELPHLKAVIFDDPRGLATYDDPLLRSFADTQAAGRAFAKDHPGYYRQEVDQGAADDVAMIAYTSGTTGRPKGALLSHRNLIATSENYMRVESVKRGDNWLAYLPMAWVGDTIFSLSAALVGGVTVNTPESPETVRRDLRELGPHGMIAPPRIWETLLTDVQVKAADASWLKRRTFEYFRDLAQRHELMKSDAKSIPLAMRLAYRVGDFLVYGPVRDQMGLRNARWCLTGGAPLGPDTFRFFRSFGINLKQIYGATELSALACAQSDDRADPNTVGRPVPGFEVRIDDSGEVQMRGPGVFVGYYKQDDATRAAITPDGWLRTGDAGLIDPQGQLAIIDRAKDVGKLADGSPFAPQFIENKLKFSPFIREAVSFGNDRSFVAAMIAIDLSTVGAWAERRGLAYSSFMDLSCKKEVAALIMDEIAKINMTLPKSTRVRRMLLLNKELEADDAEITRTRKVRRGFVAEKYANVISALYGDAKEVEVTTEITFEDGRKSTLRSVIAIHGDGSPIGEKEAA
ncbi:AMP-binding protein [Bradyrhizobium sp.]|uniref:AMP-binding protein n=1 Tax=Bradyrhizobium sp. TaxID=376 RepID=UPI0025BD0CC8|nr:AMP-binding protein [Bradyrhizobium sp.]